MPVSDIMLSRVRLLLSPYCLKSLFTLSPRLTCTSFSSDDRLVALASYSCLWETIFLGGPVVSFF